MFLMDCPQISHFDLLFLFSPAYPLKSIHFLMARVKHVLKGEFVVEMDIYMVVGRFWLTGLISLGL